MRIGWCKDVSKSCFFCVSCFLSCSSFVLTLYLDILNELSNTVWVDLIVLSLCMFWECSVCIVFQFLFCHLNICIHLTPESYLMVTVKESFDIPRHRHWFYTLKKELNLAFLHCPSSLLDWIKTGRSNTCLPSSNHRHKGIAIWQACSVQRVHQHVSLSCQPLLDRQTDLQWHVS